MKIVFLNTWNGKMREGIVEFLRQQSADTDIFCLQEVDDKMKSLCKELLPKYKTVVAHKRVSAEDDLSQATYLRNDVAVLSSESVLEKEPGTGLGIYTQIKVGNTVIHLCNFHGTARPGDKMDTPERVNQSRGLVDFLKTKKGPKIIGGDFNLSPETKSVAMFEENGYRNLIKDFEIPTTRNRLSWEKYQGNRQYYADYIFVSPEVRVEKFSVLNNEVSDHLPLLLDVSFGRPLSEGT